MTADIKVYGNAPAGDHNAIFAGISLSRYHKAVEPNRLHVQFLILDEIGQPLYKADGETCFAVATCNISKGISSKSKEFWIRKAMTPADRYDPIKAALGKVPTWQEYEDAQTVIQVRVLEKNGVSLVTHIRRPRDAVWECIEREFEGKARNSVSTNQPEARTAETSESRTPATAQALTEQPTPHSPERPSNGARQKYRADTAQHQNSIAEPSSASNSNEQARDGNYESIDDTPPPNDYSGYRWVMHDGTAIRLTHDEIALLPLAEKYVYKEWGNGNRVLMMDCNGHRIVSADGAFMPLDDGVVGDSPIVRSLYDRTKLILQYFPAEACVPDWEPDKAKIEAALKAKRNS